MSKAKPTNPKSKTAKPTTRTTPTARTTNPKTQKILLAKINIKKTQTRAKISQETVDDYAELLKGGRNPFPPLVLYQDKDGVYFLSDGFHRYLAALKRKLTSIACEVRQGDLHDALKYAFTANDMHGLRRTNADKRKAVKIALRNKEWAKSSVRTIAKLCGVSHNFVNTVRNGGPKPKLSSDDTKTRTGLDDKQYPATKKRPAAESSRGKSHDQGMSACDGTSDDAADVRAVELLVQLGQVMEELGLHDQYGDYLKEMTAGVEALRCAA